MCNLRSVRAAEAAASRCQAMISKKPSPVNRLRFVPRTTVQRWLRRDEFGWQLTIEVTTTRATLPPKVERFAYHLTALPSPFGVAFQLVPEFEGASEPSHEVIVESEADQCTCRGFQAHDRCKHLDAIVAARSARRL